MCVKHGSPHDGGEIKPDDAKIINLIPVAPIQQGDYDSSHLKLLVSLLNIPAHGTKLQLIDCWGLQTL